MQGVDKNKTEGRKSEKVLESFTAFDPLYVCNKKIHFRERVKYMNTINRMSDVLCEKYGYDVPLKEIGYESYLFYREEIDEDLVPASVIDHLVDPFQTESSNYTDTDGNYYVVIQVEVGNVEPYEVWLVNGVVDKEFLKGVE